MALLGILSYMGNGCSSKEESNTVTPANAKAENGVTPVAFAVKGKAIITRAMHAHSPIFSGAGKDSYRFRGTFEFEGQALPIDIDDVPVSMVRVSQEYFLLTQSYFYSRTFRWYSIRDGKVEREDFTSIPRELWYVNFDDREMSGQYKIWLMIWNCHNNEPQVVIDLFNTFVAEAPHSLLEASGLGLADLLEQMTDEAPDKYAAINDSLWAMVQASRPADYIHRIGFAMVKLNPEFAREHLPQFLEKVIGEGIEGDRRVPSLERVIEFMNGREQW